jgi:excisionase family DNA binding protein
MVKKLITREELSERSGIRIRTIRSMMNRKEIPYIRAGQRTVLFDLDKVMAALDKLEVKAIA